MFLEVLSPLCTGVRVQVESISKAGLSVWPTSVCLTSEIVKKLLSLDAQELSSTTIVLPTVRLGSLILASLAKTRGRAFVSPAIFTLESWLTKKAELRPDRLRRISDTGARSLITELLTFTGYGYLRPGQEHELYLLFNEMEAQRLDSDKAFANFLETVRQNSFRVDEALESSLKRIKELEHCFGSFRSRLKDAGFETSLVSQNLDADFVRANIEAINTPHYFVGFTSMQPSLTQLLSDLSLLPNISVWLSDAPKLLGNTNPLEQLILQFSQQHRVLGDSPAVKAISVSAAANRFEEVKTAIASCEEALDAGIAASRIAILVSNESSYIDLIRAYVQTNTKLSANIALANNLSMTALGSWINQLLDCLSQQKLAHLLVFMLDPHTKAWLTLHNGDDRNLEQDLSSLVHKMSPYLDWSFSDFIQRKHLQPDLACWRVFASYLQKLFSIRTRLAIPELNEHLIQHVLRPWRELHEAGKLEDVHVEHLELFWASLDESSYLGRTLLRESYSLMSYLQSVRRNLAYVEIRSLGEPLHGVQVLSLAESRYFPFDHVVILGCNDGLFPKGMPFDEVIDDYGKRCLGLPGWEALEAREDISFALLHARIPHLHLCYTKTDLGQECLASRYITLFAAKNMVHWVEAASAAEHDINPYEQAAVGLRGRFHSDIASITKEFSASSLEALITCPFRYLMLMQGVRKYPLPKPWRDVREEGEWLHASFETFMNEAPQSGREPDVLLSLFAQCIENHGPAGVQETALYHHLMSFALPRFIHHLNRLLAEDEWKKLAKGKRELSFGRHERGLSSTIPTLHDRPVHIKGKVDSVDFLDDLTMIVDYKRKSLPVAQFARSGISPQLSFYALALAHAEGAKLGIAPQALTDMVTGYWSILEGRYAAAAIGSSASKKAVALGIASTRTPSLEQVVEKMQELWTWRMQSISEEPQHFAPDPSHCGMCDLANVCRKEDPRWKEQLLNTRKLRKRMQTDLSVDGSSDEH